MKRWATLPRVRWVRRWGIVTGFLAICLFWSGQTIAASTDTMLAAKIQASNPLKPSLVLTNTSKTACQVAMTAFGTVSLTRVMQSGKTITPQPTDVASDDAVDAQLSQQLKTLKPGESASIPLRVYQDGSRHMLESVVWAPATGLYGVQYSINDTQPLHIDAGYNAPITSPNDTPMCTAAYTTVLPVSAQPIWRTVGLIIGIVVFIATMLGLWRSRRRLLHHGAHPTVAVVVFIAIVGALWHAPTVKADYDVPGSATSQFNDCMATLNEHRDITGPILDALADQHVQIEPTDNLVNDTTRTGEHSFRIYWDPVHLGTYAGHDPGSPAVISYPCPRLFHEMYHAYEMLNNTSSREDCAGSGIETSEVMATRAENALRQALGMPPRTYYGRNPLPSGDCTPPPPPSPSCSSAACGQSNGDPHVVTFDGLHYDFQAAGEFVAARDPSGGFEVQTRQQPFPGSRSVSVNTAVAMQVATDKVEVRIRQGRIVLLIGGKEQALPTHATQLPGGGTIIPLTAQLVRVQWPDGSFATLEIIGTWGLHLTLDLASDRQGKLQGLMGNFNGNDRDDLIIGGTKTVIKPTFSQIFPNFADSWRIDSKSSLFTYDSGTSTKTYTDRSFPDKDATADVPGKAAAEALCRNVGVDDPTVLADCALDVALTGRPEFALAAMHGQHVNPYGSEPLEIDIHNPGDTGKATFDGTAGQKVFINIPHSTLPDQCGGLGIVDAANNSLGNGCITNGRGFIDMIELPTTGVYTIIIDPVDKHVGQTALQIITVKDVHTTISIDGSGAAADLSTPGATTTFSFAGTAGQRVYIDASDNTLPDQCGGFALIGPEGQAIGSGCITGTKSTIDSEGIILPTTGTYNIIIDPSAANTGLVRVRVHR